MPIYRFKCENGHILEKYKAGGYKKAVRKRCKECGLWMKRDYKGEHDTGEKTIHLDYGNDPMSHLVKKRSFSGRWIENLTPQPVLVRNERQYRQLLKSTNSMEKQTGER